MDTGCAKAKREDIEIDEELSTNGIILRSLE